MATLTTLRATVFAGLAGSLISSPGHAQNRIRTHDGKSAIAAAGCSVSAAGDIDRDGYPDLLVGAWLAENLKGSVTVYSGRDGRQLHRIVGQALDDSLGFAVAAVGDLDRDGHDDFLVGAPQDCG